MPKDIINIIDYGVSGNLSSLVSSLKKIGKNSRLINKVSEFPDSGYLILPGVGSFDNAINGLKKSRIYDKLLNLNPDNYKTLGICLGMQILGNRSEESLESNEGIKLLNLSSHKFKPKDPKAIKVPHIGWNKIYSKNSQPVDGYFYFLHSFYIKCLEKDIATHYTDYYDFTFPSYIKKDSIYGCQFHPEKSGDNGLNFLSNIFN